MGIEAIRFSASSELVHQQNLKVLFNRSRGQKFMVNKDGELEEISGLISKIYYFFFRKIEQSNVEKAITKALTSLDVSSSDISAVKDLFFRTLRSMSERVYNRGKLSLDLISRLKKQKVKLFNPLENRVEDVRFALKLGVEFESVSEGHNGTYYGRDYTGKRLVVFKPYDEESSSFNSPKVVSKIKGLIFKIFPFLRTHKNIKRDCAYLNEIGASLVDRHLKLGLVPNTSMETFESTRFEGGDAKKGSCQSYIENTEMMQKVIGLPSFKGTSILKRVFQKLWLFMFGDSIDAPYEISDLKKLAVIEFLTGNQDGHTNNQLIYRNKIHAIDYGLAFPDRPAENCFSTINQYHFTFLPGAKNTFQKTDSALIRGLGDTKQFFLELEAHMTDGDTVGFDQNQKEAMKERIEILKAVVAQGKSIEYLGNIKYASDFERAREELGINPS